MNNTCPICGRWHVQKPRKVGNKFIWEWPKSALKCFERMKKDLHPKYFKNTWAKIGE